MGLLTLWPVFENLLESISNLSRIQLNASQGHTVIFYYPKNSHVNNK